MTREYRVYMAFEDNEAYKKCEPFFTRVFFDHEEMKDFSVYHTSSWKPTYPDYIGDYDKVEVPE